MSDTHLDCKNQTRLVCFQNGRRSAAAREIFQELGFIHILHLTDGIQGWSD